MAKGRFTGGRKKGSVNKTTRAKLNQLARLQVEGNDPMSFFTAIMRDKDAPYEERKFASHALLKYYHPQLASIEARTGGTTHEQRLEMLRQMAEDDPGTPGGS